MLVMAVIVLVGVILGFSSFGKYMELENKKALFQAVDNCNQTSSFENTVGGVKTKAPIRDVFVKCMADKGFKVE